MKFFRHQALEEQDEVRPLVTREAERKVNRWLVRFALLLHEPLRSNVEHCRERLQLIQALKSEEQALRATTEAHDEELDEELVATFRDAARALPGLETELRRRLAALVPNDPDGIVDLEAIRERLALLNARLEVEEATGGRLQPGTELELRTSAPDWARAGMQGIFCLGILGFTIPHAIVMIGGIGRAFGPMGLGLLLFYAIFWTVAVTMGWAAIRMGSFEHVSLRGHDLTVRWKFFGFEWSRDYRLAADCDPYVDEASVANSRDRPKTMLVLVLTDADGKTIELGMGRSERELERLADQFQEYLAAQRA